VEDLVGDHDLARRLRGWLTRSQARLVEAAATAATPARLGDIEHVVILMQENRSFDHYFGTMSAVRGFADPQAPTQDVGGVRHPIFDQFGYRPGTGADPAGYLQPFRLASDPPLKDGQTTNDISHTWGTQHRSWNGGKLDRFVTAHLAADGAQNGPLTMGYYTRQDLAFYYALADAFTVCDGYFSSVLGPTDPNRIMAMSATIDPDGTAGGPVVETSVDRISQYGRLGWETMPERLQAAGISWKVYNHPLAELALSPLPYFRAFTDPFSVTGLELTSRALAPSWPGDFRDDVAAGRLPAVSWLIPPLAQCEHPAAPPEYGEHFVQDVLATLVSNPAVWAQTVLFVVHDENGGFFDHVPPVTAPEGTAGEWLTGALPPAAAGIAGPVGLGFRTPCLVVSPFSRGGRLCHDVFDHTSLLRFLEARFGRCRTCRPGGAA
jgi:phospholipase C